MQKLKSFLAGLLGGVSLISPAVLAQEEAAIGGGTILLLIALGTLFLLKRGR